MRVLINGLPFFCERFVKDLKEFDKDSSFIFLDTYNSKLAQLKFLFLLPFADCVISFNGVTDSSGSLNFVVKWKKKLVMQWMGTDALLAMERFKNNTIKRDYIDNSYNFVDSSWLKEEVESVNVKTEYLHFKSVEVFPATENYEKIAAASYIAQNRQEFYGLKRVVALAKRFPEIDFNIFGMDHSEMELPSNVQLHGWVEGHVFKKAVKETPIFLRLTDHDGFSVAAIEALSYGAEVLMSLPSDLTAMASNEEETYLAMKNAIQKVESRGMKPNYDTIELIKTRFNRERIITTYLQKLREICGK
ncbi:MAG: hypothetical protein RI922_17 [Bacteroidota bacterium]|jgi:hypothetical protein